MSGASALNARWQGMAKSFNARSRRERGLIAAVGVFGILLLGNALLIEPKLMKASAAQRAAMASNNDLSAVEQQMQVARVQLGMDPDAGRKAEIARHKNDLAAADAALKAIESRLVPPDQMNALLERLLAKNTSLRLVSFKSLPPVNLAEAGNEGTKDAAKPQPAEDAGSGLFRHGVELKLEGSYGDLYRWLWQLEQVPQRLLWGDARFSVLDYPKAVLTVTVYTLSSEKAWLAI